MTDLEFMNEGSRIASGSMQGSVHIWDLETQKERNRLTGHRAQINCFSVNSEEPELIASGSDDTNVKIWDLRSGKNILTFKDH